MTDPFETLRRPAPAVDPDPAFAARLRARVERALALPEGVTVSNLTLPPEETPTAGVPTPAPTDADPLRQGDLGYVSLWVPDAGRTAAFFGRVLDWSYGPTADEGHARQVTDRALSHGVHGGHAHSTLFLCFLVDDIDAARERVIGAGGTAEAVTTEPFGRAAMCVDVEGTDFSLYQPPDGPRGGRPPVNGAGQGDLAYITMEVRDSTAVRAFYGSVLGWRFTAGRVEDGWGPEDVVPMVGLHGGHPTSTVVPMYRVDDIGAAVATVRGAGGTATEPESHPYGVSSECADDQGTRFYLGQL